MCRYSKIFCASILFLCILSCETKDRRQAFTPNRIGELLEKAKSESEDSLSTIYLDSAYLELQEMRPDTLKRHYFTILSGSYYNNAEYDKAIKSSRQFYNLSLKARDSSHMARALYISADAFYGKQNKDSAFYYYSQSEKIYNKINDLGKLGEVVLYKAYIYYAIGEYELCENEAFKALKLLQNENKEQDVYYCYNLISLALDGQNNNPEALKYYQNTLNQLELLKTEGYPEEEVESNKSSCYNNMGGVYVKMGQHKKAIMLYNAALSYQGLKSANPGLYAKLVNNMAYAKFKSGDTSGLPDLFFTALQVRTEVDDKSGIVASNLSLGEYFATNKDTIKALRYLRAAYNEAAEIKSHVEVLKSLKLLAEIDKENSSFYSAKYFDVNEELQEAAKKARGRFARIAYETDRLEIEKEELIKRNSFILGVSAVVLLFIAAIFIIYYLNSRNKKLLLIQQQQKASEEIYQLMLEQQSVVETARQEEKNRIAMELHDGILNNIYAVRLNLEFINKKADEESIIQRKEYIKELQKVEMEIRGVSHDLSRNAVFEGDKSFKTLLEFMIQSQKNKFNTYFDVEIDPLIDWESMNNVTKLNIYRIIQEALQNINKYSKADHAQVEISKQEENLIVKIFDNGIGFEPEKAKGGIGIKNLRKRTSMLNGNITIDSSPGNGATIEVLFPI